MTLEPADGGDLQLSVGGVRVVEQFKIRLTGEPWTPGEIVNEVLPDLHRAVAKRGGQPTRYRFVTNGALAADELLGFLAMVRARGPTSDPGSVLDGVEARYRYGNETLSARAYFGRISTRLGCGPDAAADLWSMLGALEVESEVAEADLLDRIDAALSVLVDAREQVPNKRDELIGQLLRLAQRGGSVRVEDMLQSAGLDPRRLFHTRELPRRLAERVRTDAERLGYDAAQDVRPTPALSGAPIAVLAGESGEGKTWQLAKHALALAAAGRPVVLLRAAGDRDAIEREIVRRVWLSGSYRVLLPLESVADELRPVLADGAGVWLTVCLDDLSDRALARALLDAGWADLGIRIVISAQPRMAEMFNVIGQTRLLPVGDFSVSELRRYLEQHNRQIGRLPSDMVELLLKPVLASFYCSIDGSESWTSVNEYQLIERYWRHTTGERRDQVDHRDDALVLKRLAASLLGPNPIYPWPLDVAVAHGACDKVRRRLILVGLLRQESIDTISIAHDRLLNWIVAEALCDRLCRGEVTVDALAEQVDALDRISTDDARQLGSRLGYVLLDLLWLVCARRPAPVAGAFLLQLIRGPHFDVATTSFFSELLPTLGARVIPALAWIATQPLAEAEWMLPRSLGRAIVAAGRDDRAAVGAVALELLVHDLPTARSVALVVLADVAVPQALDTLWREHLSRVAAFNRASPDDAGSLRRDRDVTFAALKRSANVRPQWVAARLERTTSRRAAEQLLFLVMNLDDEVGRPLWFELKQRFFAKIPAGARVLPQAIRYFADGDEVAHLESAPAKPGPFEPEVRFDALARIAPEKALAALPLFLSTAHWPKTGTWLRRLARQPDAQVRSLLLALHRDKGVDGARALTRLYEGDEDLLDTATFDWIIDTLEQHLAQVGDRAKLGSARHLVGFVANISRLDLLLRLQERRGGELERHLLRRAMRRRGRTSRFGDRDGTDYRRVLLNIGGEGYDRLVLSELRRSNPYARIDGLEAALFADAPRVRSRLAALASDERVTEDEHYYLMNALAAHQVDDALSALAATDVPIYLTAVESRSDRPPLDEPRAAELRDALRSQLPQLRMQAINKLALFGAPDAAALLTSVLGNAPPESDEAGSALSALDVLSAYDPELLPKLRLMLRIAERRKRLLGYLMRCGDAAARAAVLDELGTVAVPQQLEESLALALLEYEDSATRAHAYLARTPPKTLPFGLEGQVLAALAEHGDSAAAIGLVGYTYRRLAFDEGSRLAAIRAVARSDPEEGFIAAERHFHATRSPAAIRMLLTLDPPRAVELLIEQALDASVPELWHVGRALRWRAPRALVEATLRHMARSPRPALRRLAAALTGWQAPDFPSDHLAELTEDPVHAVSCAALEAERRRAFDRAALDLLVSVAASDAKGRWARLQGAIDLADPYTLGNRHDPLWLGGVLEHLPAEYRTMAERRLKQRRQKVDGDGASEERRRER